MNNAVWLLLALPDWYFSTVLDPLSAGALTLIPAFGVIALGIGIGIGLGKRQGNLLLFVIPLLLSELMVGISGLLRGQVRDSGYVLGAFLAVQVAILVYLVWRLKGARLTAGLLAVFSITYALFAALVAGMSLSDTWL